MNELLLRLTANMPMKQINLTLDISGNSLAQNKNVFGAMGYVGTDNGGAYKPYIQRYYAGTFRDGSDLWLHRFLSNDGDRHVHSHPFEFSSVMLCGGYTEEYIDHLGNKEMRNTFPNDRSQLPELMSEILLKIPSMQSMTFFAMSRGYNNILNVYDWHRIASVQPETWTAVIVKPNRLPKWFFKDDDGELMDMRASPREWWKDYKVRPECGIALDDNHA